MSDTLLTVIERYLTDTSVSPTYFGKLAAGNTMLVERLRKGKTVTVTTQTTVLDYIKRQRQARNLPDKAGPSSADSDDPEDIPAASPSGRALVASPPAQ